MRRALKVLAITMLVLGTAGLAHAQTPATQQQSQTIEVTGTVVSVNEQLLVVRTDDGELSLSITPTTEQPEQQLQVGERVRVWHRTDSASGDQVVTRVTRIDETSGMQDTQSAESAQSQDTSRDQSRDMAAADQSRDQRDPGMAQDSSLPRTAGWSPLLALFGAVALVGAAGLQLAGRLF